MRKLPKNLVQASAKLKVAAGLGVVLALTSVSDCAKFPSSQNALSTKRLIFTVNLAGNVRYGQVGGQQPYIYIIALRLSTDLNPQDSGPIPVTSFGGNGFVAGHCTHFILFDPNAGANPYQIWQFRDETALNDRFQTGVAINYQNPRNGGPANELQCEIDLSQLVAAGDVNTIQSIQANVFTMDRFALDASGHAWDAFGDGNNSSEDNRYFLFPLRISKKFTNLQQQIEPQNPDVRNSNDPDLDFNDWSIEVRLPQN